MLLAKNFLRGNAVSQISTQISDSSGLLKALEAITNRRAFLTLLSASLLAVIVFAITTFLSARLALSGHTGSGALIGLIGGLTVMVTMLGGLSAAGIHLSRSMRGQEELSITTAFFAAIATLPRFLGIFLLLGLTGLGVALVLVVAYFLCKIPGIGPLLYLVVLPISALIIGVLAYAAVFLTPLTGPAVWAGQTVFQAVATLWAILKERLLGVVIKVLLLNLMTGLVGGLIMGGILFGLMMSGGLSMLIVNDFGSNPMNAMMSIMGGGGNGHMMAGGTGALLLIASASVLPMLVWIAGNCIIFDNATAGLSTEEIENSMRKKISEVREQAEQAGKRLGEASEALAEKAKTASAAAVATTATKVEPPAAAPVCPACQGEVSADDVFCGHCRHRLK
jgi:hypothetical protein